MGDFDGDLQNPRIFIHAVVFSWEGSYYDIVKDLKLQTGEGKSAKYSLDPSTVGLYSRGLRLDSTGREWHGSKLCET
jgi:hypothetical protein